MKFEVGKEYVGDCGVRIRVVAINAWGACFEHIAGEHVGKYGVHTHDGHGWRPAPRTVERWIVTAPDGCSFAHSTEKQARDHAKLWLAGGATVNGPFPCELP
jgi:hypothetical protein